MTAEEVVRAENAALNSNDVVMSRFGRDAAFGIDAPANSRPMALAAIWRPGRVTPPPKLP